MEFLISDGLTVLAAAIQDGLSFIKRKAVMHCQMPRKRLNFIAMEMCERPAMDAADMQMALLTGIILKRSSLSAAVRYIPAQTTCLA